MSADNTLAILVTGAKVGGHEYRVAHVQAIENITYLPDYPADRPVLNREEVILRFEHAEVFHDEDEARRIARLMQDQIEQDGNFVEYGIEFFDYSGIVFPSQ